VGHEVMTNVLGAHKETLIEGNEQFPS
jgi:hypothetical protein